MHDSFYRPPVIPGHCNLYSKVKCQVPMTKFTAAFTINNKQSGLSVDDRCLSEVEHAHYESDNIACTLMNSSDSCWQINIYIRIGCDSELGNASIIPLYGITTTHNSEHYYIYIRPAKPGIANTISILPTVQ